MTSQENGNLREVNYQLLEDGTFVIENYNTARTFASFFPGIAGLKGIPLWAFYVNRNQGVAAFGIKSKDYSLMEYFPANNAYNRVADIGFRTFIKIKKKGETVFYEPFRSDLPKGTTGIRQNMYIRSYEMVLEEINENLGLKVKVRYFTLPEEPIAALIRIVEFENTGKEQVDCEIVDGLPKIIPFWMNEWVIKNMSYTAQAWATVTNLGETGLPFYRLKVEINDRPEVVDIHQGNFYFGVLENRRKTSKTAVVVDPELVFGQDVSYRYPKNFMAEENFALPGKQMGDNKYPAAMSFFTARIPAGEKQTLYSMAGHIESEACLNAYFEKADDVAYFDKKARENKEIIEGLTRAVHTESNIKEFDLYCKQTYLDNLLRGGTPIMLPAGNEDVPFYVYSRKHGDLERDYNAFQLSPSYYSQGNGNFRDMNQNKRSDIFFSPQIGDFNVLSFYNLIQLDGYNPLVVKGSTIFFDAASRSSAELLKQLTDKKGIEQLKEIFAKPLEPGRLLLETERRNIRLKVSAEEFLCVILGRAGWINDAEHGEGYWTDHWTYNIDLLESYLAVYPDREKEILLDKKEFTFYDSDHIVVPRAEKYVDADGKIRQFDSAVPHDGKAKLIKSRKMNPHAVRTRKGTGDIYKTTLLGKMICLLVNKFATLDPEGAGIEMEADKPSWYDALNGLPGVFGSSVPETFELKRMAQFMSERLAAIKPVADYRIMLPEEMHAFFTGLQALLAKRNKLSSFEFWDEATTLKEKYRAAVILGVTGREKAVTYAQLDSFLKGCIEKINKGIQKARDKKTGLFYTYFSRQAVSFKRNGKTSHKGLPCVKVTKFKQKPLPLFLEGEVHYMKTEKNAEKVKSFHNAVKESPLFDEELNMYKVNASLASETTDIGRCAVFSPGWLENESVWLHMEYKYILELLKAGLYREFFDEFYEAGTCFQDPKVYGRSILENSSFVVSSAFPDKAQWGRGFVARLSGSTAEFIEMWLLMTAGKKPFKLDEKGKLALEFKPALPRGFFTSRGEFSFMFLGKTLVKYNNPKRFDTFSDEAKIYRIDIQWYKGGTDTVNGKVITGAIAERIRDQEAKEINVFF